VSPHPEYFDGSFFVQHLVNQAVLDIDAPRVSTVQVAHEFLESRWCSERIPAQDIQKRFGLLA
jgi:hypothetical protein